MTYEGRLDRLELLGRSKAWKPLSRPKLIRQAALSESDVDGMSNTDISGLVARRYKGEPWLTFSDVGNVLVLARIRFPTKDGWRDGSEAEFALYQRAVDRFFEEF